MFQTENDFQFIRSNFLNRPTAAELQIAARIGKLGDQNNNDLDDTLSVLIKSKQTSKSHDNLIVHYTHEKRFETVKKDIHQLWNQMFEHTPVSNTKLIIGHKNNKSATQELVRRRPHYLPKLIESKQQENFVEI